MKLLNFEPGELRAKLMNYLAADDTYQKVYEYTKQRFEADTRLTAHNWDHTYRDTLNAIVIGEVEVADMSIVLPAITMHDIGFLYGAIGKDHGAVGADNLANYLTEAGIEYPDNVVAKIALCIRTHKGSMHDERPQSLEAKVVADADLLEKFGPFAVYQSIRTYTEFNYPFEKCLERLDKLSNLTLETDTGKKLAEPARQYVANYYKELSEAYSPYIH